MNNKLKQEMEKIEIPKNLHARSIQGVNQGKGKALYYIFFIILIPPSFYIYANFFDRYFPWNTRDFTLIAILLYVLAVIPLMAFLAEKIAVFALRRGLNKGKNFIIFLLILIAIPIVITINDNRGKGLDDVIDINISKFEGFYIAHYDEINAAHYQLKTDKQEHAEEIKEFFSKYRVQKMKDREWDSDVSKEKGINITIYSNGKIMIAHLYENRLLFMGRKDGYYRILNGPIDIQWMENLAEEEFEKAEWAN